MEFSKWKFEIQYFQSIKTFVRSIEMVKKYILESLPVSIDAQFIFDRSKRVFDRKELLTDRNS